MKPEDYFDASSHNVTKAIAEWAAARRKYDAATRDAASAAAAYVDGLCSYGELEGAAAKMGNASREVSRLWFAACVVHEQRTDMPCA